MPELRELTTDEAWAAAVPMLRQLWSHRDESFVRSFREEDDYRLFGRYVDGDLVAVAGGFVQTVLHHERGLWIHDFVVDEPRRGEGHGEGLLRDLEDWARERECQHLALACTLENDEALGFYEATGMERFGYVLEREV